MPSSLQSLVAATPSGRARPLLVDSDAYAVTVLRQGAPVPWTDLAALAGHAAQVHALLDPDALWVDIEALYGAHLGAEPDLLAAMGARSRTGYALRTLLGAESGVDSVLTTVRTLAEATRRQVVLDVPSPARWLARAHALAGTPLAEVGEDHADSASMYLAEWLGRLGTLPVALVLLDARAAEGDARVVDREALSAYSSLANVAGHFEWTLALRAGDGVEAPRGEPGIALVPEEHWLGHADLPEADVLLASIPPSASPERVLEQHARLR
ncbi:hypothetical protein FNH05_14565 [Amycolatopsis rhizosphaerae]|uniref:Uncharacterized protein n=2 Tax=Amycolatopsis rhizosphaerae TaxID=2053003 RepID=A0A558CS45_9PSEU|nr:hypothetical protein FNH05_14565 [Amycolatopsis rhizosphaerae]